MTLKIVVVTVLFLVLSSLGIWGQAVSKEDRTSVLKYGIETEVLDLVRALRQEKNNDYRDLLLEAYSHASTDDLKEALILFFSDLKDDGLEDRVIQELSNPEKKGNSLLLNGVSYLTALKSKKAEDVFAAQINSKNKVLALASIRALGTLGAVDRVDDLLKLYQDSETDPNFKPDLIWTFGEMKANASVDLLLKEYDDNESQPFLRRAILEAFGKIADDRAWDKVQDALSTTNTDLRAMAVSTLTSYTGHGDQSAYLLTALRDPQSPVREAGAKAAKTLKAPQLRDILVYRVRKDPEPKVRIASLQALAAYEDGPTLVLGFLGDRKTDPAVWKESLTLSLEKKYDGTYDVLKKLIDEENKEKNGVLATVVAGSLLPQRDTFRSLFGLLLSNPQAAARMTALRAIQTGKFTEYEAVVKTLSDKDTDAGVKAQAAALWKEWHPDQPKETPKPSPLPTPVVAPLSTPVPAPSPVTLP